MNYQFPSITFETRAQPRTDGRFCVPAPTCRLLGELTSGNEIHLRITTLGSRRIFSGNMKLRSGREV